MKGFSSKIFPILETIVTEVTTLSYAGLIVMLCIGGVLIMTGNEFGGKQFCKNGIKGFVIIQLASMLF